MVGSFVTVLFFKVFCHRFMHAEKEIHIFLLGIRSVNIEV